MDRNLYTTYIGAKGVAFAWIGALFGPVFLLIGFSNEFSAHFYVGGTALLIVLVSISDGFKGLKYGIKSDFVVFAVLPMILLVAGIALAWLSVSETV